MQSLTKRKQQREYFAKVNSGEVVDMAVSHGLAPNGDVLGNDLKPVAGTAAKGYRRPKGVIDDNGPLEGDGNGNGNNGGGNGNGNGSENGGGNGGNGGDNGNGNQNTPDATKLNTHAELDAALGERTKPEGWDDRDKFKVADKQAWLAANPATTNPAGWQ